MLIILFYIGVLPYVIARSEVLPGRHNIRVYQRRVGEPIPDQILGGAQFQIDRRFDKDTEMICMFLKLGAIVSFIAYCILLQLYLFTL